MTNVLKFPTKGSWPVKATGPHFCGKPLEQSYPKPKRSPPKLIQDVAQIYSEIPADLDRGQAAFIFISTVLQSSRQVMRELSDHDLARLSRLVDAAGKGARSPNLDEIDILTDMVDDETERRGGDTVA